MTDVEIAALLRRARGRKERAAAAQEIASASGLSLACVYRHARKGGWTSGRATRRDRGRRRSGLTEQHLDAVAGIVAQSKRADDRVVAPISAVVETLQACGKLPDVSPSTVCRHLRRRKTSRREMTAPAVYVSRRTEPGEVYQLDSSPAIQWVLAGEKGFRRRSVTELWNWHKPETHAQARRHLIRYFLADKCSGLWCGRYIYSTGETPLDTDETLLDGFELLGVPKALTLDRGPGNVAYQTRMLLWLLGVEVQFKGSSKNTLGSAESVHYRVQQRLEWRWRQAPPQTLDQANGSLAAWWSQDTREAIVRRSGRTRWEMFSALQPNVVRTCPPRELLRRVLHAKPEERNINGEGLFRFDGPEFLVQDRRLRNTRAYVSFDPWRMPNAVVLVGFDPETLTCEERIPAKCIQRDYFGFFAEMPKWGLGAEHPVGTRLPEHAEALREASKAATALRQSGEVDWYAGLGPNPILATPKAEAVKAVVARRAGALELPETERLVPPDEAIYRVVAGVRERYRRDLEPGEAALLGSWRDRDGIPASEIQAAIAGGKAIEAERAAT